MGIRYRMGFKTLRSLGQIFLRDVPFLDRSFFLQFSLLSPFWHATYITGKCYLLVFPEEGERSADLYRMERGTREERSPTSVSAGDNVVLLFSVGKKQPCSDMSEKPSPMTDSFHSSLKSRAWGLAIMSNEWITGYIKQARKAPPLTAPWGRRSMRKVCGLNHRWIIQTRFFLDRERVCLAGRYAFLDSWRERTLCFFKGRREGIAEKKEFLPITAPS